MIQSSPGTTNAICAVIKWSVYAQTNKIATGKLVYSQFPGTQKMPNHDPGRQYINSLAEGFGSSGDASRCSGVADSV